MSATAVRLRDVVEINPATKVSESLETDVCFAAMADVSESGRITNFQTRPLREVSKGYTSFCQGDVLLAKITPCFENGKAAVVEHITSSVGFGSTEFHVLRPTSKIDARFLFHLIWNPRFRQLGAARMTGSAGQKRVPTAFLAEYEFRLPQMAEQKRIAAILDKADSLRRKRHDAIRLADEFLRAVFIDLFGDPTVNSKSLPTKRIEELCPVATGATPSRDRPDFFGGPYPWVKTGEVDCPMILTAEECITDSAIRETNCKLFPIETLLVAMYGQGKTRGKVGMLGIPAATNQACAAILPSASISPYFLYAQLGLMYEHLRAMGRGGNQENLNLGMIKSLEVLVPPKDDIERFLSIRGRADAMLAKARRAQEDAELLTSSLTSSLLG